MVRRFYDSLGNPIPTAIELLGKVRDIFQSSSGFELRPKGTDLSPPRLRNRHLVQFSDEDAVRIRAEANRRRLADPS